jgi:NAD(P)-dependent dehydrogenase (short-subunit alcohol dehydrogenase family)
MRLLHVGWTSLTVTPSTPVTWLERNSRSEAVTHPKASRSSIFRTGALRDSTVGDYKLSGIRPLNGFVTITSESDFYVETVEHQLQPSIGRHKQWEALVDLMLSDKVAIVTGASKGIGMAVTEALADEGALVVAASRGTSSLQGLQNVTAVAMDLSDPDAPAELVRKTVDKFGRIDILVNNVGGMRVRLHGFLNLTDEDFQWSLDMNFFTTLRASRAALATMVRQRSGAIVNVASVHSFFQPDGRTVDYGTAKAAVSTLTKSLAEEFGSLGIRINAVSPGPVSTDMWLGEVGVVETVAAASGIDSNEARDVMISGMGGIATGRFTTPEEVATIVLLLASPLTANVTGANYVIDGGLLKTT